MTETPVLLLAFNRPDRLASLIQRLREVRPERVYIAVDGPRRHVQGEAELVSATRDQLTQIDWPCQVRTLFREENLGCGRGVSGAIDWLFSQEPTAIVLEDDLIPHPTFFRFCDELLDRYRDDARVWGVSGCNFVPPGAIRSAESYRFARVPHIWGWATWRRTWLEYEFDMRRWRRRLPPRELWRAGDGSPSAFALWTGMFDLMARRGIDTWDVQAVLSAFASGRLTATSNVNLVENVGFGRESTHTEDRPDYLRPVEPMRFPLVHPLDVRADSRSDAWTRRHVLGASPTGLVRQGMRHAKRTVRS